MHCNITSLYFALVVVVKVVSCCSRSGYKDKSQINYLKSEDILRLILGSSFGILGTFSILLMVILKHLFGQRYQVIIWSSSLCPLWPVIWQDMEDNTLTLYSYYGQHHKHCRGYYCYCVTIICVIVVCLTQEAVRVGQSGDAGPTRRLSAIACVRRRRCVSSTSLDQSTRPPSSSRGSCDESRPTTSTATASATEYHLTTTSRSITRTWMTYVSPKVKSKVRLYYSAL